MSKNYMTVDEFNLVMAGIAQGVVNIECGHCTIEKGSRVYFAMLQLCEAVNVGRVGLVPATTKER